MIKTLDIIRENNMIPINSPYVHLNKKTLFKRWDLMPRYLAIENHFGENDHGWELFRKLRLHQSNEFGDGHTQSEYDQSSRTNFERLIGSVESGGFDRKYPLVVHEEGLTLNKGWQRFVCCLYFGIEEVPCYFDAISPNPSYTLTWLQEVVGYTSKEIRLIREGHTRLFTKLEPTILATEVDKSDE
jgi:hypothetical protein